MHCYCISKSTVILHTSFTHCLRMSWLDGQVEPLIQRSAHLVMLLHLWKGLCMLVNSVLLLQYYEIQAYVKCLVCYFSQGCMGNDCSFSWLLLATGPLDVSCRIQLSWNLVLCCYLLLNVELLIISYGSFVTWYLRVWSSACKCLIYLLGFSGPTISNHRWSLFSTFRF
jgi:hypothetical protein